MKARYVSKATRGSPLLALGFLALAACGGEGGEGQSAPEEPGLPPAAQPMTQTVQTLVGQGNEAQRAGRYEEALGFYRDAMDQEPGHPVPEFGALMASMALGDSALVDSLRSRLLVTAPELVGMLSPDGSMGSMPAAPHAGSGSGMPGMPPGHPSIPAVTPDTLQPDTAGVH